MFVPKLWEEIGGKRKFDIVNLSKFHIIQDAISVFIKKY